MAQLSVTDVPESYAHSGTYYASWRWFRDSMIPELLALSRHDVNFPICNRKRDFPQFLVSLAGGFFAEGHAPLSTYRNRQDG